MAQRNVEATASRRVELAVGELTSLSVPPCVAVQYLPKVFQGRFSPSGIADIAECEPAIAAAVLSLAQRLGAGPARQRHAIRLVLDRLDGDDVRDALLGIKVAAGEVESVEGQPAAPTHEDLTLHSLAVACCARHIAEAVSWQLDPLLAYCAGLLHDIGKYALRDIMPRSLAAIAGEAEAMRAGLHAVELRHLGTNHTLLGRQLAQRWRLPEAVAMAIWLHHSRPATVSQGLPQARVALVVWAADHLARHAGVGRSGSFHTPEPLDGIAEALDVPVATLRDIQDALAEEVGRKAQALSFDLPNAAARYGDLLQASTASLSRMHSRLSHESRELQTSAGYLAFTGEFLAGVDSSMDPIAIAEDFARRWQRFFQTGSVCLYLPGGAADGAVDAVVIEALGHSRKLVLEMPEDTPPVPPAIADHFALIEAYGHFDWVQEQLEVDFDPGRTRLLPLISGGRAVAVIAFELNYPGDSDLFAARFATAASLAATVLDLALAKHRCERLSEQLAQVSLQTVASSRPANSTSGLDRVEALAEMAAGVAHELNNPLSVISGRAQLLAQAESDGQKRHVLEVIEENARATAGIIDDLMSFAQPPAPRPAMVDVRQIVREAVELAGHKTGADHVNAQVQVADDVQEVFVDSAQVVSAVANIVANAIESYTDTMGPVKVTAEAAERGVSLQVRDLGAGMDAETLRKATHPFFSGKPAGRKRGMGLAYAARLIELNRGSLDIQSRPGEGTAVTVLLPYE